MAAVRNLGEGHNSGDELHGGTGEHNTQNQASGWVRPDQAPHGEVVIETGRGQSVNAAAGEPFQATIERIADGANYGGFFRVFLNGEEIIDPATAPETLQEGMRITITPYDKVG